MAELCIIILAFIMLHVVNINVLCVCFSGAK